MKSFFFFFIARSVACLPACLLAFHPQSFILKAFSITLHNAKIINISLWLNEILNLWKMSSFESNAFAIRIYSGGLGWRLEVRFKAPKKLRLVLLRESRLPGFQPSHQSSKDKFPIPTMESSSCGLEGRKISRTPPSFVNDAQRVKGF